MVKLRVVVRVIPEDDYLRNLERPAGSLIPHERRLIVIVREPHKWQVGTLALEVQRAYKSCYQQELPTIKYLKDNEDDCDLDPQLYVSDLLLDEGKAARDGADQRATIKVILEQGRAVREGSVAVGSLLDNPQFQLQHHKTSRPPVPRFPGVSSSLGKRSLPPSDVYSSDLNGSKRPRQVEILETQREESVVSSIERDALRAGSPELVQATQDAELRQDQVWEQQQEEHQQSHLEPKTESPELWRAFHNIPAATVDELEELSGQPQIFAPRQRDSREVQRSSESRRPNGVASSGQIEHSHAPLTPPTDVSTGRLSSAKVRSQSRRDAASIPLPHWSTSASKFKRRDIYDYPESDIDDTQMSPRSRQAHLGSRKSTDRLSRIELLRSPDEDRVEEDRHRLGVNEALDALDNESVFDNNGAAQQEFVSPQLPRRDSAPLADEYEDSIYEDAPTNGVQVQDVHGGSILHTNPSPGMQRTEDKRTQTPPPQSYGETDDKENHHEIPTSAQPVSGRTQTEATIKFAGKPPTKIHPTPTPAEAGQSTEASPAKKRARKRSTARGGEASINGDEHSSQVTGSTKQSPTAKPPAKAAPKPTPKTNKRQRTPRHDSPGAQLSQSLQESARKQVSVNANVPGENLAAEQKKAQATAAVGKKHNAKDTTNAKSDRETEPSKEPAETQKEESVTAPKKTPRQRKSQEQPKSAKAVAKSAVQENVAPSIVVQRSEEATAHAIPLPNWGSSPGMGVDPQKAPTHDQTKSLTAQTADGSRKSSSIPPGFTEEDIKLWKSREGMTKEQYQAEKKRKQREAAAERKRQEVAARRESAGKSLAREIPKSEAESPAIAVEKGPKPSANANKARKSASAEDAPNSLSAEDVSRPPLKGPSAKAKAKDDAVSTQDKSVTPAKSATSSSKPETSRDASSTTSSLKQPESEAGLTAKTPAKKTTKTPSVKSATAATASSPAPTTTTVAKPAKTAAKAQSKTTKKSTPAPEKKPKPVPAKKPTPAEAGKSSTPGSRVETKSASKSTPGLISTSSTSAKPAPTPTIATAKNLTDLRTAIRYAAHMASTTASSSLSRSRASSRPDPKRSVLNTSSSDDDDDDSSDDDSDDDSDEEQKTETANSANTGVNGQQTKVKVRNPTKNQNGALTSSSDSTSDDDNEDESESSEAVPKSKPVINASANTKTPTAGKTTAKTQGQDQSQSRAQNGSGPIVNSNTASVSKRITLSRPDRSIRDPSVESDDSDDSDSDDEL
ncbi:hypothetical protein A1O1_08911 [Capronia coronata CBS 617.96]|uniref:Nucleolar protein Dnt1-like N-terminal domain-containing protein n=1 Tax=Capronia coronata CBS 617.96 TaxID=1182541 RepID=W9XMF7_9EURO|nr:uncharacterized protein A1O1_08911 [Capronia coronata CBS 617.96]EXJ78510.1 hypothetical protein A1O1_08911 [Capronia coronata CBS 617.96]